MKSTFNILLTSKTARPIAAAGIGARSLTTGERRTCSWVVETRALRDGRMLSGGNAGGLTDTRVRTITGPLTIAELQMTAGFETYAGGTAHDRNHNVLAARGAG